MPTDQSDGKMPRVTVSIPDKVKQTLNIMAHAQSEPGDREYASAIMRELVEEALERRARRGELPEEALDTLDGDVLSNAGGDTKEIEV